MSGIHLALLGMTYGGVGNRRIPRRRWWGFWRAISGGLTAY